MEGYVSWGGVTVLFVDSMTKMERRRGVKRRAEITERRKEISAKAESQALRISVNNKPRISGSSSKPILCPHAPDLGITSVDN